MKRTIIEIDAPAAWACHLINGDTDNYSYDDVREIDAWLHTFPDNVSECVGIVDESDGNSDAHFIGRFDFPVQGTLQCDLYTYTFLIEGDNK